MKDSEGNDIDPGWWQISRFLSLDPGVNTGWSIFDAEPVPEFSGIIRAPDRFGSAERLICLRDKLMEIINKYQPTLTVIEDAEFRNYPTGRASAASGSLELLTKIVGAYIVLCPEPTMVRAAQWKGQLPTLILEQRIKRAMGREIGDMREHEREAIGLGLAVRGEL